MHSGSFDLGYLQSIPVGMYVAYVLKYVTGYQLLVLFDPSDTIVSR